MCRPAEKSGRLHDGPGCIAQRESVPFTRERSKVRSLVRPPFTVPNLTGREQASTHGGVRDRLIKNVENNPMHSSRREPDQGVTPFPKPDLTRRAKQRQDGSIRSVPPADQTGPESKSHHRIEGGLLSEKALASLARVFR